MLTLKSESNFKEGLGKHCTALRLRLSLGMAIQKRENQLNINNKHIELISNSQAVRFAFYINQGKMCNIGLADMVLFGGAYNVGEVHVADAKTIFAVL